MVFGFGYYLFEFGRVEFGVDFGFVFDGFGVYVEVECVECFGIVVIGRGVVDNEGCLIVII